MRFRREGSQIAKPNGNKESNALTLILSVLGCLLFTVFIIYYIFGRNLYHKPPIVMNEERITQITDEKRAIPIKEDFISVMNSDIYYREANPPDGTSQYHKVDILLLHGGKYTSSTWKGLGTLQLFAYYGYRTIAIDLPGYGLSKKADVPSKDDIIPFFESLTDSLRLKKLVIIVPSMSGEFGLPILFQEHNIDLVGMILIAPSDTHRYSKIDYQKIKIPVLLMYGEKDRSEEAKNAKYYTQFIPDCEQVMVAKAEHAAFVGNPEGFHEDILHFLVDKCQLGANFRNNDATANNYYDANYNEDLYNDTYDTYDTYDFYDDDIFANEQDNFVDLNDWFNNNANDDAYGELEEYNYESDYENQF